MSFTATELRAIEPDLRTSLISRDHRFRNVPVALIAAALTGDRDPSETLALIGQLLAARAGDIDADPETLRKAALEALHPFQRLRW